MQIYGSLKVLTCQILVQKKQFTEISCFSIQPPSHKALQTGSSLDLVLPRLVWRLNNNFWNPISTYLQARTTSYYICFQLFGRQWSLLSTVCGIITKKQADFDIQSWGLVAKEVVHLNARSRFDKFFFEGKLFCNWNPLKISLNRWIRNNL